LIQIRIAEILEEENKTKYWFIKQMEGNYRAMDNLVSNKTKSIHFDTIEKACKILNKEPGDIIKMININEEKKEKK